MLAAVALAADEAAPGRPFTDLEHTRRDLATLIRMREAVRRRLLADLPSGTWQESRDRHWLVAPRRDALTRESAMFAVGFFGQAREEVDHAPILRLEHELLARAASFTALVAYHNVRFANGQWGNLVTFDDEHGPEQLRGDPTHAEALARTADHYHSVRLHRLRLVDGPTGTADPELLSTLLLDFAESPPWRAVRSPR